MRGRPNRDKPAPVQLLPPCAVCGQKAAGFHYGVTTCEACKGFFRRSLLRKKPYECVQTRQCRIGSSTARRQSCPKCRYDKCISVGMSKEAIKTGRYSLLKKSKDIYDLLQHQQSSSNDTLDEEVRVKAEQTLEKIAKAKRRGRAKYSGDFPPALFGTPKGELDPNSSPLQSHFKKGLENITNPTPSKESTHVLNNPAGTSVQHEAFPYPRHTPLRSFSPDDFECQPSKKYIQSGDDTYRYNPRFHPHRHEWNHTSPVAADANSLRYQYPPIICQCMQRHASIYYNDVTMDHPPSHNSQTYGSFQTREYQQRLNPSQRTASSSASFVNDGPGTNWSGSPYIHANENFRSERFSDTYHGNSLCQRQLGDYHKTHSHSSRLHKMEDWRSSPLTAYMHCDEQDDPLHSLKSCGYKPHFSEKRQTSPYTLSEATMDCFPVKADPDSPQSQSISNGSHDGMPQVNNESNDGQDVDKNFSRVGTDCENLKLPEMTFEKLIAQSIAGEDNWGAYGSYGDVEKDKCMGVDRMDKQNTDTSPVCASDNRDVHSGYDTMDFQQEKYDHSGFKPGLDCSDSNSLAAGDMSHQKLRKTEQNPKFASRIVDDMPFSILDIPRFIVGSDAFELPFIEAFPRIRSAMRSIWEKALSEAMESSTAGENSQRQQNESKLTISISTKSAFTEEHLDGFNFSDYNSNELEDIISGLIKSHEESVGPDSNYLSERQVQTALNVFQGLRRLKQELRRPYQPVDSVDIWSSPNIDLDFGRDMVSRFSLRSNKNLPKVLTFYRSVPGFRFLSSRDKVTLVRGAITEFLFLSSVRGMDHKSLTLVDAINLMTLDLSTITFAFPLFGDLSCAMQLVSQELRRLKLSKDTVIVLKALSLMTQDRANLENPEQVKQMYQPLLACLQLLLKKQYGESTTIFEKIGTIFHTMRLSIEKFKQQRDENLKKLVEDIHVPLFKETVLHFLFE